MTEYQQNKLGIKDGKRIIDNMNVDISAEAYAIMKESWQIREPTNHHQKEIKILVDEISFWRSKFSYMFGENTALWNCLGFPQKYTSRSDSTKVQSTNLRIVHKSNN